MIIFELYFLHFCVVFLFSTFNRRIDPSWDGLGLPPSNTLLSLRRRCDLKPCRGFTASMSCARKGTAWSPISKQMKGRSSPTAARAMAPRRRMATRWEYQLHLLFWHHLRDLPPPPQPNNHCPPRRGYYPRLPLQVNCCRRRLARVRW